LPAATKTSALLGVQAPRTKQKHEDQVQRLPSNIHLVYVFK